MITSPAFISLQQVLTINSQIDMSRLFTYLEGHQAAILILVLAGLLFASIVGKQQLEI